MSMNKLTHVESQRVMNVLEQTFHKLNLISYLSREVVASTPEEIFELIDDELMNAIRDQKKAEDQYTELVTQKKTDPISKVCSCVLLLRLPYGCNAGGTTAMRRRDASQHKEDCPFAGGKCRQLPKHSANARPHALRTQP